MDKIKRKGVAGVPPELAEGRGEKNKDCPRNAHNRKVLVERAQNE